MIPIFGAEVPFEVIDVDGEGYVGRITELNTNSIRLDTGSENMTFLSKRVEVVQNLLTCPFLLPNKPNNDTPPQPTRTNNQRTIIINGQAFVMDDWGRAIRNPNLPSNRKKAALPPFLQRLRNLNETAAPQQTAPKIPQFPESVIVIELLDGSRLVATRFVVRDQKAVCNLLDHNYTAPTATEKISDNKTNSKPANENKNEKKENGKENEDVGVAVGGEAISEVVFPFDQIYSVRFAVKSFSDIFEPPAEWLKYVSETGTSGDRLVISKSGTFDSYSGIVADVTRESVIFSIDGEKLPIQRSKIYGMILHSPDREQVKRKAVSNGQITLWSGTQLMLDSFVLNLVANEPVAKNTNGNNDENNETDKSDTADIDNSGKLSDGKISWKALAGFSGTSLLSETDSIVFSRGNSLYFADILPVIRERLFPFEWSDTASKSDNSAAISKFKLFQASRFGVGDKNSSKAKVDPSLELAVPSSRGTKQSSNQALPALEGVVLDGVLYRRGLMLPPKTRLEYVVSDGEQAYSAIRGFAGVDDRLKPNGRAKLTIEVDGKLICSLELRGTDKVKPLRYELPKTQNKKISITVDFADNTTEPIPIGIGDLKLIK
ncbi:MAG: NPCBM/NEW2 domain-containing protein [Planctomycetaceae bacterium]|nr:NPCBM/NEW2 domain-containing protein [Planctomycetaceae bacterium]